MKRRINLFGGPGSGKSTTAAMLFAHLKKSNISVEHCTEYVKRWVYLKRSVSKHDQIYLFAKQQQTEYTCLNNGVGVIVTDSPCFLSYCYARKWSDENITQALALLNKSYDADYPPINIFIRRGTKPYHQEGRWQTKSEAEDIDKLIRDSLDSFYPDGYYIVDYGDMSTLAHIIKCEGVI